LQVGCRDHRGAIQAVALAIGVLLQLARFLEDPDQVDDHPPGGEGLQVLEAEFFQAVLRNELAHRHLVVIAVPDADVAHAVEVGADVTLAEPRFLHTGRLVLAQLAASRQSVGRENGFKESCSGQWDAVDQNI